MINHTSARGKIYFGFIAKREILKGELIVHY